MRELSGPISVAADVARAPAGRRNVITGLPRVIDGDTLDVNGLHVRINGVDAEEVSHGPRSRAEPNGNAARAKMQEIVGVAAPVRCELTGTTSYDRKVGTCFNSRGEDVGAEMVKRGAALDCAHFSGGKYRNLEPSGIRSKLIQKPYC